MNILFWIHKSKPNVNGQVPIIMRITIDSVRAEVSTHISIEPEQWDMETQRVKGNTDLIKEYNNRIINLTTSAWNYYNEATKSKEVFRAKDIKDAVLNKKTSKLTLLGAFDYQISNLSKRVGLDVSPKTVKNYEAVRNKLKLFIPDFFKHPDVNLNELTSSVIAEFDFYMRKKGLKHNAVIKNMQNLRSVVRICLKHGWLEKDPFVYYSFRLDDTERGYLSPGELKTMEEILLPSDRLDHVRDIFIFCCYTGLAYADVSKVSKSHIEQGEDGIIWIKLNRSKTKSRSVIPLLPRAREILDKYSKYAATNPEKKLLPVISNQNLNKYLKEVAVLCGISKRMSMHLARHTFATTVTLGRGVDIMTVSKMLGHKNLRTTQIYSKVTELKIADDMKKLM